MSVNDLKKVLTIHKRYVNRVDTENAKKRINQAIESGIGSTLKNKGWRGSAAIVDIHENSVGYVYTARVTFVRSSTRSYTESSFENDWGRIEERFLKRAKTAMWELARPIIAATQSIAPIVSRTSKDRSVKRTHFGRG